MAATFTFTCPVTGNPSVPYAGKGRGRYLRDPHSGIIFLAERPTLEAMAAFVDGEYQAGVYRDYVDAKPLKLATARRRLARLMAFEPGPRWLDVGCAAGFFIEAALEAGFDASGIELSAAAIGLADPAIRPRIVQGDVNMLLARDARRFDVVTAFDIIEHTFDPRAFVADISRVLVPGGLLVISTPDTGHWLRVAMGAHWPMLQPDQHTFLLSRDAMRDVLADAGYAPLALETAHKVLTMDYLFGQLRQTNPLLARILDVAKHAVPRGLRHHPLAINIGEMLACARKG